MKKLRFILCVCLGLAQLPSLLAQQVPVFHQFLYNPHYINPAYTGIGGQRSVALLHRQQWLGFEDAPSSSFLTGQIAPFAGRPYGLGLNFSHDQNFVIQRSAVNLFPSAHFELVENHLLAFGINLGVINYSLDFSVLQNGAIPSISVDPLLAGGENVNEWQLDAGVGIGYQFDKGETQVRIGGALSQLSFETLRIQDFPQVNPYPHMMLHANVRVPVTDQVSLEPSFLYKQVMSELLGSSEGTEDQSLILQGGELDGFLRATFQSPTKFWVGVGSRMDVGEKAVTSVSPSNFWAINGAIGVDITEQLQINVIAEIHKYLPFSIEAGIVANFGEGTPKEASANPKRKKDVCDPLWRNPECLDQALVGFPNRPQVVQVIPIIGAKEFILIYRFSDESEAYELGKWDRVNAMVSHIQEILSKLRTGKEPLGSISGLLVTDRMKSSRNVLNSQAAIPYEGEYGSSLSASHTLDNREESYEINSGAISQKALEYLKMLTLSKTIAPNISPELNILTEQNISSDREITMEIRILRK
ncbi:MAG: PorP/SprF family type IX secretion system membrane protein [Bacteroidota bacterium]